MKIFVKAKPLARQAGVKKIDETHFLVAVKEPPSDGQANLAIVAALATYFGVAKSRVRLCVGGGGKNKIFEII